MKASGVARAEDEVTILTTAPRVATSIMQKLSLQGASRAFAELHGLLTLMCTYLILGARHVPIETRRVIDKNIAPFLSRTLLHLVMQRLQTTTRTFETRSVSRCSMTNTVR